MPHTSVRVRHRLRDSVDAVKHVIASDSKRVGTLSHRWGPPSHGIVRHPPLPEVAATGRPRSRYQVFRPVRQPGLWQWGLSREKEP
eukprot:4325930-Pyramimonas_sp.AAC.1